MTPEQKLSTIIEHYKNILFCGAIIHESGEVTDRIGDYSKLNHEGIVTSILGPYGSPGDIYQMVSQYESDQKMLPRSMVQGDKFALMDKPQTNFDVVVFGKKNKNFQEYLTERKMIGSYIMKIFSSTN